MCRNHEGCHNVYVIVLTLNAWNVLERQWTNNALRNEIETVREGFKYA